MNKINDFYKWIAWKLPAGIVMWCYIRVVSLSGDVPLQYKEQYDAFVKKYPHLKKQGF